MTSKINNKKNILAILGSTSANSSNKLLLRKIIDLSANLFEVEIFDAIDQLPHFNPDLDTVTPPLAVSNFRAQLASADGILICTPEYVFSLPGSLKNAIEWCVSTVVLSKKPMGLIVAAASGIKAMEELKLIMKTVEANFNEDATLLIQGIKGKINSEAEIKDQNTLNKLYDFISAFNDLTKN